MSIPTLFLEQLLISFVYILSITVAVSLVILVGLFTSGIKPQLYMVSTNVVVCTLTSYFKRSILKSPQM